MNRKVDIKFRMAVNFVEKEKLNRVEEGTLVNIIFPVMIYLFYLKTLKI